jgi:hypothetical protein
MIVEIEPNLAADMDRLMQAGYHLLEKQQVLAACQSWQKVWDLVRQILEAYPGAAVEEVNRAFHGLQSIDNWSGDFTLELLNAGNKDSGLYRVCIEFCEVYLARTSVPGKLNNLQKRRAMGESYFRLGRPEEGETCFREVTRQYPRWGWGWISWANQYSFYTREAWHNLEKAEQILRQGLASTVGDDRSEIKQRLRDVLMKQGRPAAASLAD